MKQSNIGALNPFEDRKLLYLCRIATLCFRRYMHNHFPEPVMPELRPMMPYPPYPHHLPPPTFEQVHAEITTTVFYRFFQMATCSHGF